VGVSESVSRPLVLIVDDQPECSRPLAELLSADADTVLAEDWQQALEQISSHSVDLILLDVGLPVLDGFAICERLKLAPRSEDIPVIFITAQTDEEAERRGFSLGAVDYVHKPFAPELVLARVRTHLRLRQINDTLARQANTDGLTGLANRRAIDSWMSTECRRDPQQHDALSLLLLDLDHFKHFNDSFGHEAGDQVLKQVGALLAANTRSGELIGRWGGEEFVLLSRCDLEGATTLAERIRCAIAEMPTGFGPLTVSIGVGQLRALESPGELFSRVDQALLNIKRTGRNRVQAARSGPHAATGSMPNAH
jgi:diguanylate cyclase (GGDEF)-like protein